MRKLFALANIIFLCSCSAYKPLYVIEADWPEFGYIGFADKVNRMVGDEGVNCGFIDQVNRVQKPVIEKEMMRSQACIERAIKAQLPFRYGSIRIASTSYLHEIVFMTPEQIFWRVIFDRSMDGSENMHIVKQCKSIAEIDVRTATFEGVNCRDVPTDEWLLDIVD